MTGDLLDLVHRLGQPHVMVVGDVMLDRYVWGDAERISQEAPVILLRADRREERLGGASSVANLLRALGAKVSLAGIVGDDMDGGRVRQLLTDLQIDHDSVLCDAGRPTTVKERYIGRAQHRHPQQMIRVDYEDRRPLSNAISERLRNQIERLARRADIILISDYDKGVCTQYLLREIVQVAAKRGVRVLADPIRGQDYSKYRGCSAITPNRLEAGLATGMTLDSHQAIFHSAEQLRRELELEASIITLDKDGMALCHRNGKHVIVPTRPRQVYDITGAGDMVLGVLGMALAAGADYENALRLANIAGGLEVEKIGVATVTRDEILRDLLHSPSASDKIMSREILCREIGSRKQLGQRVAFTNGCFDLLHVGHVRYLQDARNQADVLVVGLNSDSSVRALKGDSRPIQPVEARAQVLAGLQAVDYICIFDETTPMPLIESVCPDVLVKGADYRREDVVGADFVECRGGCVYLAPLQDGFSTTELLEKLRAA